MIKTVLRLTKIKVHSAVSSTMMFMQGKKSTATGITVGAIAIIVLVVIAFMSMMSFTFMMFTFLLFQTKLTGCEWFFFACAAMVSVIFSLVGSVFAANSYLFEATDNELLLSMPIEPSAVLLSRIFMLYLVNCVYSWLILAPVGVACQLFGFFSPLSVFYYVLSLIFLPLLVTALGCVFGYIFGKIADKLPNKKLVSVVFGFGVVALLVYLVINLTPMLNNLLNNITEVADDLKNSFPPLYWYGSAMSLDNPWLMVPILLICTVPMMLAFLFLSTKFTKIVTHKKAHKKKVYVEKPMLQKSQRTALMRKELSYFFSIPAYVMNAGFSTIAALAIGVLVIMKGDFLTEMLVQMFPDASYDLMPLIIGAGLSMCCIMNDISAPSISLEGKTLWLIKSTPVKCFDIFLTKSLMSPIISLPGILFTAIVSAVCLDISAVDVAFIVMAPFTACLFSGFLGVCVNLKLPRFDWATEITVIKQSMSVIVSLIISMIMTSVPFLFAILPVAYFETFSIYSSYLI
ncbi:MAG: hypothetical protein K2M82_05315, partial [Lachnospiraceae bacterium]|nr:hypothetical protein [Lachnospiraceae bacterium]